MPAPAPDERQALRPPFGVSPQPSEASPQQPAPVEAVSAPPPVQPVIGGRPFEADAEATGPMPAAQAAGSDTAVRPEQAISDDAGEPAPVRNAAAETAAPAEPKVEDEAEAGADEPHGLGWLLSMSGLGAVTPEPGSAAPDPDTLIIDLPDATTDAPISDDASAETPVSGAPVSGAPISGVPVSSLPTSGAAPKQDWFSPTTETRLIVPKRAEEDAEGQPSTDDQPAPEDRQAAWAAIPDVADPGAPESGLADGDVSQVARPEPNEDAAARATDLDEAGNVVEPAEPEHPVAEPAVSEPIDAEWTDIEPADPEPTAKPGDAEPIEARLAAGPTVDAQLVEPEAIDGEITTAVRYDQRPAEPVDAEIIDAEIIEPEPTATSEAAAGAVTADQPGAEPIEATLIDAETGKAEPFNAELDQTTPVDIEPVDTVDGGPAQAEATPANSAHTEQARTAQGSAEPVDSEPARTEPMPAAPLQAEPLDAASDDAVSGDAVSGDAAPAIAALVDAPPAEPIDAEIIDSEPGDAEPTTEPPTETLTADSLEANLVNTEPAGAQPTEPVNAQPAEAEPTEPVNAQPAEARPIKTEQAETEQADAALVEAELVEAELVEAELVEAEPFDAEPATAEPTDAEQGGAEPTEAEPADTPPQAGTEPADTQQAGTEQDETDPADLHSTNAKPTDPELIEPDLIDPELVKAEATETVAPETATVTEATITPAVTDPAKAELANAEPTNPQPTDAEPANAEPANAGLTDAEPTDTEPNDADPTDAEPAGAGPAAPEPVTTDPAQAVPVEPDHSQVTPAHHPAQETATPPATVAPRRTVSAALRTPSAQLPVLNVPPPPQPDLEPERRRADPEQILTAYPWKLDPITLRETADDPEPLLAVRDRLTDRLEYAERDTVRASLLSLRAVVSRALGDLGRALADAREALRHAEATGELRRIALVQARLAGVQQWRGDFAEADRLFEDANSVELPDRLRAEMHVHAGKSCYEQGRYLEACNHFEAALELRRVEDPDLVARTEAALDAVMARVREAGWGPYPRSREEILQRSRPPHPALDYDSGWQGYADSDGEVVIPERYAEAQPFHEGVAWVRRPGTAAWELIDETGALVIDPSSGYVQVSRFADGLAWVSREPAGGWFAVDWHNRVIVPGGFEEVRPYRNGLAVVRRGGWGAIDRHGRIVVQFKYHRFATELTAGGPVEGFTSDGLAVIDAGDRLGVVDRGGQLRVAPVHARLLIHPMAFVVGDRDGRWGALDRNGDPVVEVTRPRPGDVVEEIERLLSGTRPVL